MKRVNLLLSCPSDVFSNFGNEIKSSINEISFYIEKILDIHLELQYYLTSSFSEVGRPAQNHLDDTLIIDSDICIAFYYHKLGTPTENYKSGTDEEIHLMMKQGKHVSLFRIYDSENDADAEEKLNEYFDEISKISMFTKIYGRENIYNSLKTDLINYIVSSFNVNLIKMDEAFNASDYFKKIIDYDGKKNKIISLIEKINMLTISKNRFDSEMVKSQQVVEKSIPKAKVFDDLTFDKLKVQSDIFESTSKFLKKEVLISDIISNNCIDFVNQIAEMNNLKLDPNFFSFHEERIFKNAIDYFNNDLILEKCPIKEKVLALIDLEKSIRNYLAWEKYLNNWNDLILLPLALENSTTTCFTQINVKLRISKDDFGLNPSLTPEGDIIPEMYVKKTGIFFNPYCKYAGYEEFKYSFIRPEVKEFVFDAESINYKETVINSFDDLFDYEIEKTEKEIIVKVSFSSVNPGEMHCFPTYLILKKMAKNVYFEITGSSLPRKISSKITL